MSERAIKRLGKSFDSLKADALICHLLFYTKKPRTWDGFVDLLLRVLESDHTSLFGASQ